MTNMVNSTVFRFHDARGGVEQNIVIPTQILVNRSAFVRRAEEQYEEGNSEHVMLFPNHGPDAWFIYRHILEYDTVPHKDQDGNLLVCSEEAPRCGDAEHPYSHELCQKAFDLLIRTYLLSAKLEDVDAKNCVVSALIAKILDGTRGKDETLDLCLPGPKAIALLWDVGKKPHYTNRKTFLRPARQVVVDAYIYVGGAQALLEADEMHRGFLYDLAMTAMQRDREYGGFGDSFKAYHEKEGKKWYAPGMVVYW
jgi:hypothetical protein